MEVRVRVHEVRVLEPGRTLVEAPSWEVRAGDRWALTGPNGSGKSTLLSLLVGRRHPSEGSVLRSPGLEVVWIPQQASWPEGTLVDALLLPALRRVAEAEAVMRAEEERLAQGEGDLERYATLVETFEQAGGYEARDTLARVVERVLGAGVWGQPLSAFPPSLVRQAQLALAITQPGDLLLLDEPSNGLDVVARKELQQALRRLPPHVALVIASHDRDLLANVTRQSAWLEGSRLRTQRMRFDDAAEARGVRRRNALARRPRGSRVGMGDAAGEVLLRARGLSRDALFSDVGLDLTRGNVWVLLGGGGTGRSTLLSMLAARTRSDRPDAEVWLRPGARFFDGEARSRGLSDGPVWDQLLRWVREPRAASLLSLVALPQERWQARPSELSGGERARAALAVLLGSEPDVIVLDEPERDLDLAGLDLLEQALSDGRSAVLMTTHDLRLAEGIAHEAFSLEEGKLVAWRGGVTGWRQGRPRLEASLDEVLRVAEVEPEPAQSPEDVSELEEEQLMIEELLEDPMRLSERDRVRLELRRDALIEARMAYYEAASPPPAPRYRSVEPPLTLWADRDDETHLRFTAEDWPSLPHLRLEQGIAHLVLPDPRHGVWLPWARAAALRAALGIIFPVLAPEAVQVSSRQYAPPAPFASLDEDWWVVTRTMWEASVGISVPDERPGKVR